jgi:hypothetical protein
MEHAAGQSDVTADESAVDEELVDDVDGEAAQAEADDEEDAIGKFPASARSLGPCRKEANPLCRSELSKMLVREFETLYLVFETLSTSTENNPDYAMDKESVGGFW